MFPTVAASARVGGRSKQLEIYQTFAELKYVSDDESFQDEIDLHDMHYLKAAYHTSLSIKQLSLVSINTQNKVGMFIV